MVSFREKLGLVLGNLTGSSKRASNTRIIVVELLQGRVAAGIKVSGQAKIVRDLGLDSPAIMDFVMDLEARLHLSIPLEAAAEIETVDDLCRVVEALAKKAG